VSGTVRLAWIGVAGMALVAGSGCLALAAGAAAGVGTYAYVKGELKSTFEAGLDQTWEATQKAVDDLQFTVKEKSKDALQAREVAREADGTDVKIALESKSEKVTEVRVRVGVFGNESQSRLIMDRIKARLGS
jgi:hypothetical protein